MAAVAGDADNINKQARKMRTNWVNSPERATGSTTSRTSKRQTASCPRPQWGVPAPPLELCGRAPPPFTYGSCSPHTRCRGIACHVRECVVFLFCIRFLF